MTTTERTDWDYLCPDDCCGGPDGTRSVMDQHPDGLLVCPQCDTTQRPPTSSMLRDWAIQLTAEYLADHYETYDGLAEARALMDSVDAGLLATLGAGAGIRWTLGLPADG